MKRQENKLSFSEAIGMINTITDIYNIATFLMERVKNNSILKLYESAYKKAFRKYCTNEAIREYEKNQVPGSCLDFLTNVLSHNANYPKVNTGKLFKYFQEEIQLNEKLTTSYINLRSDIDDANTFLSKNICSSQANYVTNIYQGSSITVSDLFVHPVCSLYELSDLNLEREIPMSDSVQACISTCISIINKERLLIIKGPYGCGKTLLSKVLMKKLQRDGLCVCFSANSLDNTFFSKPTIINGIDKCLAHFEHLYIFVDSCEILADSTFVSSVSELTNKKGVYFIINYRSICKNDNDNILSDFQYLRNSVFVLNLDYFNRTTTRQWLDKFNQRRIGTETPVITYDDIERLNKNFNGSCKNPLILYMISSFDDAKKNMMDKNWYEVFNDFIRKTINGKFAPEKGLNPFFIAHNLDASQYRTFLTQVASSITRDRTQDNNIMKSEDDFILDNNHNSYSIRLDQIKRSPLIKDLSNRGNQIDSNILLQTLNCYFFEINQESCSFRDNNILFFFKANNYTEALRKAVGNFSITQHSASLNQISQTCIDVLSKASSGMIIHPVEIEFILSYLQKDLDFEQDVQNMIYCLIDQGVILNIPNINRCKVDYEIMKTEILLCIIYMRSLKNRYDYSKISFFFKRLSQYHSFVKLVDSDLASIIQRYFCNITIASAEFRRINLKKYNFTGSKLFDTKFIQCKLDSVSIRDVVYKDTTYEMCLISNIKDGDNANISGSVVFKGCKFHNVTIHIKRLTKITFEECVIDTLFIKNVNKYSSKGFLTFKDCIIRQCKIDVPIIYLSYNRYLVGNKPQISCDKLYYYPQIAGAEFNSLFSCQCKNNPIELDHDECAIVQ